MKPLFAFNPFDPIQRQLTRDLLESLDRAAITPPPAVPPVPPVPPVPLEQVAEERVIRRLPKLLRLGSGELIILAVQNYGPDVQFDVKELARKTGKDTVTILSKNRTLAHSCKKRGIQKSSLLQEHGGTPRRFSVPSVIHAEVSRLLALQPLAETHGRAQM